MEQNASLERAQSQLAAAQLIMSLSGNAPQGRHAMDGVILVPGLNGDERIRGGFRVARDTDARYLLCVGRNEAENTRFGFLDEAMLRHVGGEFAGQILVAERGDNTAVQFRNIPGMLAKCRGITHLALVADGWHTTRAVLTFAHVIREWAGDRVSIPFPKIWPLFPAVCCPLDRSLDPSSVEHKTSGYGDVIQAVEAETARLGKHKDAGDLADLVWLLRQSGQYAPEERVSFPPRHP